MKRLQTLTSVVKASNTDLITALAAVQREFDNVYRNLPDSQIAIQSNVGLTLSGTTIGAVAANANQMGMLSAADWKRFDQAYSMSVGAGNVTSTERANWNAAYAHSLDLSGGVHGATDANVVNMIVRRDAAGAFSMGVLSATGGNFSAYLNLQNGWQVGDDWGGGVSGFYLWRSGLPNSGYPFKVDRTTGKAQFSGGGVLVSSDSGLTVHRLSNPDQEIVIQGGDGGGIASITATYTLVLDTVNSNPYGWVSLRTHGVVALSYDYTAKVFIPVQVYGPSAWFRTQNASGGDENVLDLGDLRDSLSNPSYRFRTNDLNNQLVIYSLRWGAQVDFTRGSDVGEKYGARIQLYYNSGAAFYLFNNDATVHTQFDQYGAATHARQVRANGMSTDTTALTGIFNGRNDVTLGNVSGNMGGNLFSVCQLANGVHIGLRASAYRISNSTIEWYFTKIRLAAFADDYALDNNYANQEWIDFDYMNGFVQFGFGVVNPAVVTVATTGLSTTGTLIATGSITSNDPNTGINLNAGNDSGNSTRNQLVLGWHGTSQYRHAIKSRHDSGITYNNGIDFYTWQLGDGAGIGSNLVFSTYGASLQRSFTSPGWTGGGWRLDYGVSVASQSYFEVDNLRVRHRMDVYELVVNQIRATNGAFWVTDVAKVESIPVANDVIFADPDHAPGSGLQPFAVGDRLIVQRWDNTHAHVSVVYIQAHVTVVNPTTFDTCRITVVYDLGGPFSPGDIVVRVGNPSDATRQNSVYITSDDANAPYIDVMAGVTGYTFSIPGNVKTRLGNLAGITGLDTINGQAISGYGLYSTNAFLKGGIVATYGSIGAWNVIADRLYVGNTNAVNGQPALVMSNAVSSLNGVSNYYQSQSNLTGYSFRYFGNWNAGVLTFGRMITSLSALMTTNAPSAPTSYFDVGEGAGVPVWWGVQMFDSNFGEYFALGACVNTNYAGAPALPPVYNRIAGWAFDYKAISKYTDANNGVRLESTATLTGISVTIAAHERMKFGRFSSLIPDDTSVDHVSSYLTNPTFTGGSTGWTIVGNTWSYNVNNMLAAGVNGASGNLTQNFATSGLAGKTFLLKFVVVGVANLGTGADSPLAKVYTVGTYQLDGNASWFTVPTIGNTYNYAKYITFWGDFTGITPMIGFYNQNNTANTRGFTLDTIQMSEYPDTFVFFNETGMNIYKSPAEGISVINGQFSINAPILNVNGIINMVDTSSINFGNRYRMRYDTSGALMIEEQRTTGTWTFVAHIANGVTGWQNP